MNIEHTSHEHTNLCTYDHPSSSSNNKITPKIFHGVTTPTGDLAGFIISDLLQIPIYAESLPILMYPLLQQSILTSVYRGSNCHYCCRHTDMW